MVFPLESIDQLYYTVTRITTHYYSGPTDVDDHEIRKATGFFYGNDNKIFLITNRHVVIDEKTNYFPNIVRLRLHTNANDLTQNKIYDIDLWNKHKRRWIEPTQSADIIAIPIEEDLLTGGFLFKYFNRANLLPSNIQLQIAEDVFVTGYPLGVYDDIHNLPILRNGIIASAYPIPFRCQPYFLVDSYLVEGMSGSPVMTKFKDTWRTRDGTVPNQGFSFYILGIISSTFPVPEGGKPLELTTTYFAEIIEQMTCVST
jgi:hypothetical protein